MRSPWAHGLAVPVVACALLPAAARAYSDPAQYALPATEAGGAGRFYTGSPADPHSCDSCHTGASAPAIELLGLPARYVPRATYELRVKWSRSIEHASSVLEVTDEHGRGAGTLAVPDSESYLTEEECEPADAHVLAGQLYQADRGRTIAASPDCGQSMLRVQWTAPETDVGPVWIAGAVVVTNLDGSFTGDGVTTFAQPLPPFGGKLPDITSRASCAAAPISAGAPGQRAGALLAWLAAVLVTIRLAGSRTRCRSDARPRIGPMTRAGG